MLNRFTLEQRMGLLEIYFQNKDNWGEITRQYPTKFGCRARPTLSGISKFIAKVRENGFIVDKASTRCDKKKK